MKIYFELGELKPLTQFINIPCPRIITCNNGYKNMIIDATICIKNRWDIYTNEIALLGSHELFGEKFLHKIMIRDDDSDKWIELNPNIISKLAKPINIEQYFRRFICK